MFKLTDGKFTVTKMILILSSKYQTKPTSPTLVENVLSKIGSMRYTKRDFLRNSVACILTKIGSQIQH